MKIFDAEGAERAQTSSFGAWRSLFLVREIAILTRRAADAVLACNGETFVAWRNRLQQDTVTGSSRGLARRKLDPQQYPHV